MRTEKNRPANSSDDWTLVITCAWHYHKSQTADNTWAENYWKITRHYTTHACCYNRKTGLDLIVSHFEITVHIGHYTHKWILNIKIKHGIWHSIIANNLCDKLSQKGDKNPYTIIEFSSCAFRHISHFFHPGLRYTFWLCWKYIQVDTVSMYLHSPHPFII